MWESQLERDYIYLLEIDTDIVAYCEQPFTIAYDRHNRRKKYTPDFLVERKCSKQVVEVKPNSKVESFINSDRFLGITSFCSSSGMEFVIVTEKTIRVQPRLDNIKLLYKYARADLPWSIYTDCLNYFQKVKISTISEICKSLRGVTQSSLLKLLWNGFLLTDLMQPISPHSSIQLSLYASSWQEEAEA